MDPSYQQNQSTPPTQQVQQPQQATQVEPEKTNTLAIVGLVLSFLMAPVGLILSIIAISQINKRGEKGRGLAIGGIAVSVAVILLNILFFALVFSQFNNVQTKARDSERKADIRLIESKLAEYRADNSSYPATLQDIQGIPIDALKGPKPGEMYNYSVTPEGCTTEDLNCTSYSISGDQMEAEDNPYLKTSLY